MSCCCQAQLLLQSAAAAAAALMCDRLGVIFPLVPNIENNHPQESGAVGEEVKGGGRVVDKTPEKKIKKNEGKNHLVTSHHPSSTCSIR